VGVHEKTEDADAAKHRVDAKVAPAGRMPDDDRVTLLHPPTPVALTMKRIGEPALMLCGPGTDNVGGATTVKMAVEVRT